MFQFLRNTAKKAGNFIRSQVQPFLKKVASIPKIGETLLQDYPPSVKAYLRAHGSTPITSIKIFRHPIPNFIDRALDFVSLGKWSQLKAKYNYEKFYHLGLILNNSIQLEREQTMKLHGTRPNKNDEFYPVTYSKPITLSELLDTTVKQVGTRFFRYSAFDNNCQEFVTQVLRANGLLTPGASAFINQPVDQLVKELPGFIPRAAQLLTDVGGVADSLSQQFKH